MTPKPWWRFKIYLHGVIIVTHLIPRFGCQQLKGMCHKTLFNVSMHTLTFVTLHGWAHSPNTYWMPWMMPSSGFTSITRYSRSLVSENQQLQGFPCLASMQWLIIKNTLKTSAPQMGYAHLLLSRSTLLQSSIHGDDQADTMPSTKSCSQIGIWRS